MKPKVFLAHAKEDARWVHKLYDLLRAIGANPWMTPIDIETLDPEFKSDAPIYIVGGGSFAHEAVACRSGGKYYGRQDTRSHLSGFRFAWETE